MIRAWWQRRRSRRDMLAEVKRCRLGGPECSWCRNRPPFDWQGPFMHVDGGDAPWRGYS